MQYSKEDAELLSKHVSNLDKDIYVVHGLPPEVVSTLFAYASRSPASFRDNLLKMIKEEKISLQEQAGHFSIAEKKAAEFHKKWVVGFGHMSIAEHAVLNIAIENVSILLTKIIEDNRLASYTEKSTRYQIFDRGRYYKPKKIMKSRYCKAYERTLNSIFDFYTSNFPMAINFFRERFPKKPEMSEQYYESYIKGKACDVLRYALPAATLTCIGATFNARSLVHAIEKMLSSNLDEAREVALSIKEEASKFLPTLCTLAEKSAYIEETENALKQIAKNQFKEEKATKHEPAVKLIDYDKDAEDKLIAAIMYKHLNESFSKVLAKVKKLSASKKQEIFEEFFKRIKNRDEPLREIEHASYTFEILVDYGAYRDLQRHRMCTQTTQLLSTRHGFSIPEEMKELGIEKEFCEHMKEASELYEDLAQEFPLEAQYCVPLAYKKRTLFTMNARELYHIIRLRSGKAGHKSYRAVAKQMYLELKKVHPMLAKYFIVDLS